MGLSGARNSAVTGLQAQSTAISIGADNIANATTPGYKAVNSQFSTLVTSAESSSGYSSGGVSVNAQNLIEEQGLIETTGRVTDLAISGTGFLAVQDDSANLLLTRAGSFEINNRGELVNPAGLQVLGWPVDNDGLLPGEVGNSNTTAKESTNSLVVVDTNSASGTAAATSTISSGLNLNAGQTTFQGATVTLDPDSSANNTVAQDDIIVPATGMQEGDTITLTSNSVTDSFQYGGFAKTLDITSGTGVFSATTLTTTFTAGTSLVDGDQFTITTTSSGIATFTYRTSSPDSTLGEFNSFDSLATAIDATTGLTARTSGGRVYVSSAIATEAITFGDVSSSDLHNELGFSNELAAATGVNRWNTISGLATLVNDTDDFGAVINSPSSASSIDLFAADPLQTLTVTKVDNTVIMDLQSDENGTLASTGLIVPVSGTSMAAGDTIVVNDDQDAAGTSTTVTYGGFAGTGDITANSIFGASTTAGAFSHAALDNGDVITFTNGGADTVAVRYQTTPTLATDFNSLATLASAIDQDADFVARIVNNRLYISSDDATEAVTYTATTDPGSDLTNAVLHGQFDQGDGTFSAAGTAIAAAGAGTFNTMAQLDALLEAGTNISTTTANSSGNTTISVSTTSTTTGIEILDSSDDLIAELGIADNHDVGDGFFTEMAITGTVAATAQTGTIAVTYDPTDTTKNMAGGNITPHFSRNMEVFDALGTGHNFRMSFLKTGVNEWAVEFYAITPSEITGSTDGQVATGTVTFNGDGTLRSVSTGLSNDITISWTTGASNNTVSLNMGTAGEPSGTVGATSIGLTDGLRQFDSAFNVEFIEQNGVAAGQFKGITITEDGTVNANFSNGEIKAIYQLPVLTVANQNALTPLTGNTFSVTQASGEVNLKEAGQSGAGTIVPGSLEGSTADIAEELTKTIGIQSNYNANATLISTVRDMEEELNRRL